MNIFTESRSGEVNVPKVTIHRKKTVSSLILLRYDLIDGSNHAKVSRQIFAEFSNMAIHKFITSQTTA